MRKEIEVGKITHYYTHLGVAAVSLFDNLKFGDTIHIKGNTSDFVQKVESMQIEHEEVNEVGKGSSIGLEVIEHAREQDKVYKIIEES